MIEWFNKGQEYMMSNLAPLIITAGLLVLYILSRTIAFRLIRVHAKKAMIDYGREKYTRKLVDLMLMLVTITIIGASWEISFRGLSIYFASIFTVIGVGLFATWSILSNLTASVILFFFFPYRIGNKVRIIDGDNSIEGVIMDLTLFYIRIETTDRGEIAYPNNLAIQKPILEFPEAKEL